MKLEIYINYNQKEPLIISFLENNLQLTFTSFIAYQEYLSNPYPLELFAKWEKECLSKKELKEITLVQNKINSNLKHLTNLIKLSTLHVTLNNNSSILLKNIPKQRMLINLKKLNPNEILRVLELPWPPTTRFLDTFNPYHQTTKEELIKAYSKIYNKIKLMKQNNLTPAEVAFYAFDEARKRIYIKNEAEEDLATSRDLSCVLEDEKIVCAGYAQIFCAICSFFNVPANTIIWHNKNNELMGHASCLVYLNDSKYNLHGIYSFDPTLNRKLDEHDTEYINNCSKAFIPINMDIKSKTNYEIKEAGILMQLLNRFTTLKGMLKQGISASLIVNRQIEMIIESLNAIYKLIGLPLLDLKGNYTYQELEESLNNLGNQSIIIPLKTFQELATMIRIYEHDINPEYPINEDSINKLVASSFTSNYNDTRNKSLIRLLSFLEE